MKGRKYIVNRLMVFMFMLALLLTVPATGRTIYVDPNGSADFIGIQAAIDNANDYDEIKVAPGIYNEAINFNGKAVRLCSIGGSEATTINGTGHYHVVQCVNGEDANTILEGFTITSGNANGPSWPHNCGGGMYNSGSNPTVNDCNFSGNSSINEGGGMYNYNSSPTLNKCRFSENSAGTNGGGISNIDLNPEMNYCSFMNNNAQQYGGGVYNYNSSPTVNNCTFFQNQAPVRSGGGMCNWESSPLVVKCIFRDNSAWYGGGMSNHLSYSQVIGCSFIFNIAQTQGGAMYNLGEGAPTITNCTFSGNTASSLGGGILNDVSSPVITNCILWGNTPDEICDLYDTSIVGYSDVRGGWPGILNVNADPCFVDTTGGDLRLSSSVSPCVDTGNNDVSDLPDTDLVDKPRIVDGDRNGTATVDIGAFEFQPGIHNITQDRWYDDIQVSIDDANNGDQIEVSPGTYNEAINFIGKTIRLYSSSGPEVTTIDGTGHYHVVQCVSGEDANTILEGFTITGGNANGPSIPHYCGGGMYNNGSSPTVAYCIFHGNTAELGGAMYNFSSSPFVANCTFSNNTVNWSGGGIFNRDGSIPTVTNCTFSGNQSGDSGGGMYNYESSMTITNCTFSDNSAGSNGGGMYNYESSSTVNNCTFKGNSATHHGGGMRNDRSIPTVTNCLFIQNHATTGLGGGIANVESYNIGEQAVTHCSFIGNTAAIGGGGMSNSNTILTVTNCTFSGNMTYSGDGGGMLNNSPFSTVMTNCILWGDTPDEVYDQRSSIIITYSDVQGGWSGMGNIDEEPYFVDANNPDTNLRSVRLMPDSPCIDAADSDVLLAVPVYYDLDGNDRYVDIEAVDDTGTGPWEFLDMGAYEFHCSGIAGDIDCDGFVNFKDLARFCANWLKGEL